MNRRVQAQGVHPLGEYDQAPQQAADHLLKQFTHTAFSFFFTHGTDAHNTLSYRWTTTRGRNLISPSEHQMMTTDDFTNTIDYCTTTTTNTIRHGNQDRASKGTTRP